MPQFIVRVYRNGKGYRVVVDSMIHFDVPNAADVEKAAKAAILGTLCAYYPDRPVEEAYPGAVRTLGFDLKLVRTAVALPEDSRPTKQIGSCAGAGLTGSIVPCQSVGGGSLLGESMRRSTKLATAGGGVLSD
jgi:hypothetical protein